jgi:hypothetical protein
LDRRARAPWVSSREVRAELGCDAPRIDAVLRQ